MRFDIAILGGGPAGLTAATVLARAGARVVVSHRPRPRAPRPGETLPGAGLRLLASLDLPTPRAGGPHRALTGIASAWDARGVVETDYLASPDGAAWLIDRSAFDAALAAAAVKAGVQLRRTAPAFPARCALGWSLDTFEAPCRADFLIDASGRAATLSRRLSLQRDTDRRKIAWWCVIVGQSPARLQRPLIERSDHGWWFAIALDQRRTYVAYHTEQALGLGRNRVEAWRRALSATVELRRRLAGAGVMGTVRGCVASGGRAPHPVGDGWAACGDAAMCLDPLSSQGLFSALASGRMLAEALSEKGLVRDRALAGYDDRMNEIWSIYARRLTSLEAA